MALKEVALTLTLTPLRLNITQPPSCTRFDDIYLSSVSAKAGRIASKLPLTAMNKPHTGSAGRGDVVCPKLTLPQEKILKRQITTPIKTMY